MVNAVRSRKPLPSQVNCERDHLAKRQLIAGNTTASEGHYIQFNEAIKRHISMPTNVELQKTNRDLRAQIRNLEAQIHDMSRVRMETPVEPGEPDEPDELDELDE